MFREDHECVKLNLNNAANIGLYIFYRVYNKDLMEAIKDVVGESGEKEVVGCGLACTGTWISSINSVLK